MTRIRTPLDEKPLIKSHHKKDSSLLILGSVPEEGIKETPFDEGGKTSRFFMWALSESEIYFPSVSRSYTVPRYGRHDHPNTLEAFELLKDSRLEEIHSLFLKGIRVILALGDLSCRLFSIPGSLKDTRGSIYLYDIKSRKITDTPSKDTLLIVPTYEASYLYGGMHTSGRQGKADLISVWIDDLKKARKISKEGWTPPREIFNLEPSLEDIRRFRKRHANSLLAVDIETTGLDPKKAAIVCIGFASSHEEAIVIPYLRSGGLPYWSPSIVREVNKEVTLLLAGKTLYQNALFDVPFLRGRGFEVAPPTHDTLLLHHAVSPELPHKLGFIVSQYGDTPYWKDEFQNRDTTIVKMNQETLRRYNARDCVVLHQVLPNLLKDLKEVGAEEVYHLESIPLIEVIASMQETGVLFSPSKAATLKKSLKKELTEIEIRLRESASLPKEFNLASDDDLRLFLFGTVSSKYDKGEDYLKKKEGTKIREALRELYTVRHETIPFYVPKGFKGRRTPSGSVTVNKQGRLSYIRHLIKRLNEIASFKRPDPRYQEEATQIRKTLEWLELFQEWTELDKLLSTYFSYEYDENNRVHSQFLIHGTATGRLASRSPNLQNLPKKRAKDIRSLFVAPPNHRILAADYSNLEVRVMAYETGDPQLIDIVDNGKNMHDINTRILFKLTPDDPQWNAARRAAKIFMFGSLAYGGGDNEIYEKVILDVPELELTFKEFVEAKERYMEAHPVYVAWRERITSEVTQNRQVRNAFNRVRTFYGSSRDIIKEALNFPIQSAAASIINRAMVRIHRRLKEGSYVSRLQAQIHDELRLEVLEEEYEEVRSLVIEEMTRPLLFYGIERSFDVECESGPDWGNLS